LTAKTVFLIPGYFNRGFFVFTLKNNLLKHIIGLKIRRLKRGKFDE